MLRSIWARSVIALAAMMIAAPLPAQTYLPGKQAQDSNPLPVKSMCYVAASQTYAACQSGSQQESYQLVAANVPSAAVTVYGGNYILSQTCTAYGTLTLQVRGPDGTTYQTVTSKTSSDTTGGTAIALGSFATVRATVTGTTGCNAILARVPA